MKYAPSKIYKMEIHVLVPTTEQKKRLVELAGEIIDLMENKCSNDEEQAFILKMLVESFEYSRDCKIPIK